MTISTKDELQDLVEELEKHRGRHTELITVYISAGYDINSVQKQLEAEQSTAKNIKSTATRKNVIDALEKIVRFLKDFKGSKENGIAVFCGNVSKIDGQDDLRFWSIEPPRPLKVRLYRCDKEFVLEPLKEQLEVAEIYALLVMDRKEATIGVLEGKRIEILQKMTSGVPSKVRAGGQCLGPDTLVTIKGKGEIKIKDVKVGDNISSYHIDKEYDFYNKILKKWNVKKNIIYIISLEDGNSIECSADHVFFIYDRKNDWTKKNKSHIIQVDKLPASELQVGDNLLRNFGKKVSVKRITTKKGKFELIDIEVQCGEFFANGLVVHNSAQRFHRITEGLTRDFYKRIANEMKTIFYENTKLKGILVGGPIPTKDEFVDGEYLATKLREKIIGRIDLGGSDESGIKELVEKSRDLLSNQEIIYEKKLLERFFETLGEKPDLAAYKEDTIRKALEYGAVDTLLISKELDKSLAKDLKQGAINTGAKVEMVSTETEEGKQFFNLSGMGAILRFKYE